MAIPSPPPRQGGFRAIPSFPVSVVPGDRTSITRSRRALPGRAPSKAFTMHIESNATPERRPSRLPAELEDRAPLTYRGQRVLTTELAAKAFGASERQLRDNASTNAARFEAGKHFFKIEGAELRDLKDSADFTGSVGSNAKSLTLWTERGVARHAKILDTDTAWEIFESLEDHYFRGRRQQAEDELSGPSKLRLAMAREARLTFNTLLKAYQAAGVTGNHALISAGTGTRAAIGVDFLGAHGVPRLEADIGGAQITVTDIGRALGLTARETNKALIEHDYQTSFRDAKDRIVYQPTDKGRQHGGRMAATGKKHHDGTPVTQLVWSTATIEALRRDLGIATAQ